MPKILAFSSYLVTLKFTIHNVFKTRVLLKIFDAEFPYKLSYKYFEPLCLFAKMAAKTVKRPNGLGFFLAFSDYCRQSKNTLADGC